MSNKDQSFKEFFSSPNGVTTGLAIIIALVTLWFTNYPLGGERPSLDISTTTNVELSADPLLSKKATLSFIYNGEQVQNLVSTKIRIINSGDIPLTETDFIQGLNILFPLDTRIINSTVIQTQPLRDYSLFQQGTLQKETDNVLSFKPILINPGEIFDIDILTTREGKPKPLEYKPEDVRFEYKILGVTSIRTVSKIDTETERHTASRQKINELLRMTPVLLATMLGLVGFMSLLDWLFRPRESKFITMIAHGILALLFGVMLLFILYFIGKLLYEAYFL